MLAYAHWYMNGSNGMENGLMMALAYRYLYMDYNRLSYV